MNIQWLDQHKHCHSLHIHLDYTKSFYRKSRDLSHYTHKTTLLKRSQTQILHMETLV